MTEPDHSTPPVPDGHTPEEAERWRSRHREAAGTGRSYMPAYGWERYESRRAAAKEGRPLLPCLECDAVAFADGAALGCWLCAALNREAGGRSGGARAGRARRRPK